MAVAAATLKKVIALVIMLLMMINSAVFAATGSQPHDEMPKIKPDPIPIPTPPPRRGPGSGIYDPPPLIDDTKCCPCPNSIPKNSNDDDPILQIPERGKTTSVCCPCHPSPQQAPPPHEHTQSPPPRSNPTPHPSPRSSPPPPSPSPKSAPPPSSPTPPSPTPKSLTPSSGPELTPPPRPATVIVIRELNITVTTLSNRHPPPDQEVEPSTPATDSTHPAANPTTTKSDSTISNLEANATSVNLVLPSTTVVVVFACFFFLLFIFAILAIGTGFLLFFR